MVRLVGIQPMTGDHLEWQLTVPPGPEEQEASIPLSYPIQLLGGLARQGEP
jgi:hypothetical protein